MLRQILHFISLVVLTVTTAFSSDPGPAVSSINVGESDWPWWRGPGRTGIASPDQDVPLKWSADENIRWRVPVPGRGHGAAIVAGDHVYLAAADHNSEEQLLLCFDRGNGSEKWRCVVHKGGFPNKGNKKASLASSTPACDGTMVFINFVNSGAVYTTAVDLNGQQVWQQKISDYVIHQGYGSSPALFEHLVIVSADNKGGGAVAGLNRATGRIEWKRDRPSKPNYASPVILQIAGRDQLLFTGCDLVTSLNPLTGEKFWEIEGATTECVTTTVTDGVRIFTSGGYPKNHIAAVAADGSGKLAWEKNLRAYVPSMVCRDGLLYATLDAGIATCLDSESGEELWKARLAGTFSSSPVLVGDRIYATNEKGTTFVFRATGDGFEELSRNQLGDDVFATPTICGGRIYQRVAVISEGERQEFLYCIGSE